MVGREGSRTVWLSHRGILLAVSPEHLAKADDHEVQQWMVVNDEIELMDVIPPAGGNGFIDLRRAPVPPDEPGEDTTAEPEGQRAPIPPESVQPPGPLNDPTGELSSSSLSIARMRWESERDATRSRRSSEFFSQQDRRRKERKIHTTTPTTNPGATTAPRAQDVPIELDGEMDLDLLSDIDWEPDRDDFHTPAPRRQLSPMMEGVEVEAAEREAKRQRAMEPSEQANFAKDGCDPHLAAYSPSYLNSKALDHYYKNEGSYMTDGINVSEFMFGVRRNYFRDKYEALAAGEGPQTTTVGTAGMKKKGRKELKLSEISDEHRQLFVGTGGADEKEWSAWKVKEACEILSAAESRKVRREKPELIVPTRWVRTNKNDGLVGKDFLAKSRLVVQGFKDKSLGHYRRDAPTASAIAESVCLAVCAYYKFVLIAKDIKNAYFSGKNVGREIYLEPPKGGLPGLEPGRLLKAKKAIYGFAEAARLFWLALREYLESDGWRESRLEPALFYLRVEGILKGILVTHVDDIEGGIHHSIMNQAFAKSAKALEFATNHVREFIFRGREIKQHEGGNIDVAMRNYALSMRVVKIDQDRRKQLKEELNEEKTNVFQSSAGELGWLARQLRCDLAYENGVAQRSKVGTCIADLVLLKQFVGLARRGADFKQRYWSDVDLANGVILHLADSGHANGTPDHKEEMKYKSVGGYFILVANKEILEEGGEARANILAFHSSLTKRVCRSTLAAEASHLAEAVEAGDWIIVLLEEALSGELDLSSWPSIVERRRRAYITDARSVYDYLEKDATSTSSDKRMAIEGALLRETVRRPNASTHWIDGAQNIANVLTKHGAEKETLREFLRSGKMSFAQTAENKAIKERKRLERQQRKTKHDADGQRKVDQARARQQEAVKQAEIGQSSDDDAQAKKEQGV